VSTERANPQINREHSLMAKLLAVKRATSLCVPMNGAARSAVLILAIKNIL
jgi:hypothetical protein